MEHEITVVDLPEQPTAVVRGRASPESISEVLGHSFEAVARSAAGQGRRLSGPPFARYRTMDESGWDLEAGFPVDAPIVAEDDVEPSTLPACRAARLVHTGPLRHPRRGVERGVGVAGGARLRHDRHTVGELPRRAGGGGAAHAHPDALHPGIRLTHPPQGRSARGDTS